MIINLYNYRSYIVRSAWIEFWNRYAGVSHSFLWSVLQPLLMIVLYFAVFSMIFSPRVGGDGEQGFAYALYLCAGYFPWVAMTECATHGSNSFINNAVYLKKLPIPEQVFVAKEAVTATYSLILSFVLLMAVSSLAGHYPKALWILLPLPLILFQLFAFGLGLFLGVMNVFFREVGHVLGIVLQGWFWLTPIVYPADILPAWLRPLISLNPAQEYISAVRVIFLRGEAPAMAQWGAMIVWSALAVFLSYLVLRKFRAEIRDCI
jgi:lipopolysaccharide transport system permease protein